jgi:alkylation response protein AidB-like acyl-CoA dehydrogenase
MDLSLAPEDDAVVREAVEWLSSWLPADYRERFGEYRLDLGFRRAYQRDAFEAGWLVPAWEPALGGHGVGPEVELLVKLEFARRGAPKLPNVQGPGVIAPALLGFGDEEQRRHVVPVLRGDAWWCLGMSEPGAGSDLASLRTSADAIGDGFVLRGQKVWTSHARESDQCLLFARTDPSAARHRGISAFVVPMNAAGISVRRIAKIGVEDEEFCEVFLEDVAVGAGALLGPLNEGWRVAMESLAHERDMIWIMNLVEVERALDLAADQLRRHPRPELEGELGRLEGDARSIWLTGLRGLANRIGGRADVETPLLKLQSTEAAGRAFRLVARALGPAAVLDGPDAPYGGEVPAGEIESLAATLYGGTSEIQRNLIGERILGLPR